MKHYKLTFCFILSIFLLTSCATGNTVISKSADLSKYQYACLTDVMNYSGSASFMDAEVKIYDALEESRLKLIGDHRISELSFAQKEQLLLVRFAVTQTKEETRVSVNFVDYINGKPIASCQGAQNFGVDNDRYKEAIEKVQSEILKLFPKN